MRLMSILAACAFICGGCYEMNDDGTSKGLEMLDIPVYIHTVRGHDYLIVTVSGGISAVHAASCPCMNRNETKGDVK